MSPERRERRGFEPPPWEKNEFDELQKKRVEEPAAVEEPVETGPQPDAGPRPQQPGAQAAVVAEAPAAEESETAQAKQPAVEVVDPAKMAAMLANLRDEEPSSKGFWAIGIAVALFMGGLGAVLMVWGIVALMATRGSGQLGWMAAAVLIIFGTGFIAIAGWVAYKNLQRQGVL